MDKHSWEIGTSLLQLGEILVDRGHITQEQLGLSLDIQKSGDKELGIDPGDMLGAILVKLGHLDPMTLVRTLCEEHTTVNLLAVGDYLVEPRAVLWLAQETAEKYSIFPMVTFGDDTLMVAADRPLSDGAMSEVIRAIGDKKLEVLQVKNADIDLSIKECYDSFLRRGLCKARIGELLIRDGFVSVIDFQEALDISKVSDLMVGQVLIEKGIVDETDLFKMISIQRGIPLLSSDDIRRMLDRSLAGDKNKAFCKENFIVPYSMDGDMLYLATSEPFIEPDEVKEALGSKEVHINLATYSDVTILLEELFGD